MVTRAGPQDPCAHDPRGVPRPVILGKPRGEQGGSARSIARAVGITTVVTAAGYGVTLLQQALFSRSLGVSVETDVIAAVLAWMIGITGFIGTTISTVYLPAYVRSLQDD